MSRRSVEITRKTSQYARANSKSVAESVAVVAPYRAAQLRKAHTPKAGRAAK